MILSASRRTDIPCFYGEWLMRRLRAGYALVRNPMNHAQISRVPLTPDVVDCIVFWTKDPENFLQHLDGLDRLGYSYYFQFTLTPYGRDVERNLRPKPKIEETFLRLSRRIGAERTVWRYDPILLTEGFDVKRHKEEFRRLCELFEGHTDTVTLSLVDIYAKLRAPSFRAPDGSETEELAPFMAETARQHGIRPVACCESGFERFGIERSACIDRERIEKMIGQRLDVSRDRNQRAGCGCCESTDIGAYNTCLNGCVYCYATDGGTEAAKRRFSAHDPSSELLTGSVGEGEHVTKRKVRSNIATNISLF